MAQDYGKIQSAQRTMQLLELLAAHSGQLSVTQIAKLMDVSIASVSRLLATLSELGYVEKNAETHRYSLSYMLYALGSRSVSSNALVRALIPVANSVARKYDVSVNINSMAGRDAVLLWRVTRFFNKDLDFIGGETAPAYCTSAGKAMLSTYSEERLADYLSHIDLSGVQNKHITESTLREELSQVAKRGYSVCPEEYVSGVFSISFPLRDRTGGVFAFTVITRMNDVARITSEAVLRDISSRLPALIK